MPTAELTAPSELELDGLRRQHARHARADRARHCVACHALWPCAYRTAASNRLRALNIPVAGIL